MEHCADKTRQAFADQVRSVVEQQLAHGVEIHAEPGHCYGFYLRGTGWPSRYNGFAVPEGGHPCLVVSRAAKLSLPEGRYEVHPNIGPDGANHANLFFMEESVGSAPPSPAFLDRLVAIIRSATDK